MMRAHMAWRRLLGCAVTIGLSLGAAGCHEDNTTADPVDMTPTLDSEGGGSDVADMAPVLDSTPVDAAPDAAPRPAPGEPVPLGETDALDPRPDAVGAAPARAFVAAEPGDLVTGPTAQGRLGDYVLENGKVRIVVEADDRVIGPCPYGGNVIDGDIRRAEGEPGADMIGEICLLMNLGQTLDPQRFEIVADGSDGGAAVLAVTGVPTVLDFINLKGLLSVFLPGPGLQISYDVDGALPLTITVYYVLRPGDTGVRVIAAMRNDSDEAVHLPAGHLVDSGGDVEVLNPLSPTNGFGNAGFGSDALGGVPLAGVVFNGPGGGHAYVPSPDPDLDDPYPSSGRYLWVAGVVASVLGVDALLPTLLAVPARVPDLPGIVHLEPGAIGTLSHWHLVGDGTPDSLMDEAWRALGVETVELSGRVRVGDRGLDGARIAALDADGRVVNQAIADGDGRYDMQVPRGAYTLRPWKPGHLPEGEPVAVDASAAVEAGDVVLADAGRLVVSISDPQGAPVPGRITVSCEGPCPQFPDATQRDVDSDGPLESIPDIIFTGMDGRADIPLAPGSYRVAITRGSEWSVWPPDAISTGGALVEVVGGEDRAVTAEIAQVIDSAEWLSGDFHVHGINSPDAPVSLDLRVRTFLAEGVDVLVSTDHDYITDYRPTIAELGAEDALIGVVGIELTTFDYGHYNSFPLQRDPQSRNGGALDWAGGRGGGLTPDEIFRGLEEGHPGEQVIQINHPDRGGIGALDVDILRGFSRADPAVFRLPPVEPDPVTGDTGLWSERFTALEIMNGHGVSSFNGRLRWWLTMVGRGLTVTATAVSDTHKTIVSQSGGPRSYVHVGPEHDRPATFDPQRFAEAVNDGRLFGSNGPFVDLVVRAGDDEARLGDTLRVEPGAEVQVDVRVQTPGWMAVNTVDLFVNIVDPLLVDPDTFDETALPPTASAQLVEIGEPEEVAAGAETHTRRRWQGTVDLVADADAYIVAVVHGPGSMFPVVLSRGVSPKAYTNPVYLDVDGGGYNTYPLAAAAGAKASRKTVSRQPARPLRLDDLYRLMDVLAEEHAGH